jgi:hypothetical protein
MVSLRSNVFIKLTEFLNFSSLQTLAAILQAEPKNSDSRNAGQARPIEDPTLAGKDQVFQGKIKGLPH